MNRIFQHLRQLLTPTRPTARPRADRALFDITPVLTAFQRFANRHPRWANSLFDEHFLLSHAAGLLYRRLAGGAPIAPGELADAWINQLNWPGAAPPIGEIIAVAAHFLQELEAVLGDGEPPEGDRPATADLGHVLAVYAEALRDGSNRELDWLWLAKHLPHPADRRYCLNQALRINPESALARRALRRLG